MMLPQGMCVFRRKNPIMLLFIWHNPSYVQRLQHDCRSSPFPQSTYPLSWGELGFKSSALVLWLFIFLTVHRTKSPLQLTEFHFENQWDSATSAEMSCLWTSYCSELLNWQPWLTSVMMELISDKCLNSPVALLTHQAVPQQELLS